LIAILRLDDNTVIGKPTQPLAGTFLSLGLVDRETKANEVDGFDSWKYTIIDPVKAADLAYEIYPDEACMYAIVRGLITTVAAA